MLQKKIDLFTMVYKQVGGRGLGAGTKSKLKKTHQSLNIYFLSVGRLTINDIRNEIIYAQFAIYFD